MFDQIQSPLVGQVMRYLPDGFTPLTDLQKAEVKGAKDVILWIGDTVTVLSAWTRSYLPDPGSAPTLFYVISHETGYSTHVIAADLK